MNNQKGSAVLGLVVFSLIATAVAAIVVSSVKNLDIRKKAASTASCPADAYQSGGYCWYLGNNAGQETCSFVCANHGLSCAPGGNDDSSCTVMSGLLGKQSAGQSCFFCQSYGHNGLPAIGLTMNPNDPNCKIPMVNPDLCKPVFICSYRDAATTQDCNAMYQGDFAHNIMMTFGRACACNPQSVSPTPTPTRTPTPTPTKTPTPTPSPTSTPTPYAACTGVKYYRDNGSGWIVIDKSAIQYNDVIQIAAVASAFGGGVIDKAHYRINGSGWTETLIKNGNNEYYFTYTFNSYGTFAFEMEVHVQNGGWY